MTQTSVSNAIVNVMLGWLKGIANWVLKLFNLAGSGGSPLGWLSANWLLLLVILLILGITVDRLVWLVRWRPYWVWFRKERVIINDERFISENDFKKDDFTSIDDLFEQQYEVPSAVFPRDTGRNSRNTVKNRRISGSVQAKRPTRPRTNAVVPLGIKNLKKFPVEEDLLFEINQEQDDFFDGYEDEVFNVSNLPERSEELLKRKKQR